MSDFGESLALLANLKLESCQKCGKKHEKGKLVKGLCPSCRIKKTSTLIKKDSIKKRKTRKSQKSSIEKELEGRNARQQALIEKLSTENLELIRQINILLERIEKLEKKLVPLEVERKETKISSSIEPEVDEEYLLERNEKDLKPIVVAFYDFETNRFHYYNIDEVSDQLILKMIMKIETNLNSAGQIRTIQIIGENYINKGKNTPIEDVQKFIRSTTSSFNRTFLPLANSRIKKLGKRTFHCEIIEKTFTDELAPSFKVNDLGKRYFAIWKQYFERKQVIKRIEGKITRKRIEKRGMALYRLIHSHFIQNNSAVTRQELFKQYKLRKYDIDTFKHNLIKIGLVQKVPLPKESRYHREQQIPRYEVALQPRFPDLTPKDLETYLKN
jgi:hypothetical protein